MKLGTIIREATRNPNNLVLSVCAGTYLVQIWRNHRWTPIEVTYGQYSDIRDTCERTLMDGTNRTNSAMLAK